jgi:RNA polymerase sigma-70 factor (ECF subfamily)
VSALASTAHQGDWHDADRDASEVDATLVRAFRSGDVFAFESIYRLPHRAEDIAQEAFLRLVRQLLAHDGEIRVRAWLHRTTTNLAIDEHRRLRTMQHYHEQASPMEELQRALERYHEGHPERAAERREIRLLIVRVIEHLPERYRRILALRELEGMDYPRIAERMGLSISAVESLLFRARRRFTEVYDQISDEPGPLPRRRRRRELPPAI